MAWKEQAKVQLWVKVAEEGMGRGAIHRCETSRAENGKFHARTCAGRRVSCSRQGQASLPLQQMNSSTGNL
jgi:hypothetical protein